MPLDPWRPFPSIPYPEEQADRRAMVGALARALRREGELTRRGLDRLVETTLSDPTRRPDPRALTRMRAALRRAARHAALLGPPPDPAAAAPEDVDLVPLVREATALVHATLAEHVLVHTRRELQGASIHADPIHLFYVVAALLLRAGATAEDGRVRLVVEPTGPTGQRELHLTVTARASDPHRSFGFGSASLERLARAMGGRLRATAAPWLRFDLRLPALVQGAGASSIVGSESGRSHMAPVSGSTIK